MNKTLGARREVYRFLYEHRVNNPDRVIVYPLDSSDLYVEAALLFGRDLGHFGAVEGINDSWRMTAQGMLYAETCGFVEGED